MKYAQVASNDLALTDTNYLLFIWYQEFYNETNTRHTEVDSKFQTYGIFHYHQFL